MRYKVRVRGCQQIKSSRTYLVYLLLSYRLSLDRVVVCGLQSLLVRGYRPLLKEGLRRPSVEAFEGRATLFNSPPSQVLVLEELELLWRCELRWRHERKSEGWGVSRTELRLSWQDTTQEAAAPNLSPFAPHDCLFVYLFVCMFVCSSVTEVVQLIVPPDSCWSIHPLLMARNPPLPDPDGSEQTPYQYESEGEEKLGESARALVRETGGNYRCECDPEFHVRRLNWASGARTALLAYTR